MRSIPVIAGEVATIHQYNKLRLDAKASSYLDAHEQDTPDLTLKVSGGTVWFDGVAYAVADDDSPTFTAPVTDDRIDALSLRVFSTVENTITQATNQSDSQNILDDNYDAQTFLSDGTKLRRVTVRAKRNFALDSFTDLTIRCYLYAVDGSNNPTGSPLATSYFSARDIVSANTEQDISFDFNATITDATTYAIVIALPQSRTTNWIILRKSNASVYADGQRKTTTNGGTSWTNQTDDLVFTILMEEDTFAPELIRTAGTESATPVAPQYPDRHIPICLVYNRPGQTEILNDDDASNGYVYKDEREFVRSAGGDVVFAQVQEACDNNTPVFMFNNDMKYYYGFDQGGGSNQFGVIYGVNWSSHIFSTETHVPVEIERIQLQLLRVGTVSGNVEVTIREETGTGAELATATAIAGSSVGTGSQQFYDFVFPTPFRPVPFRKYAIVVRATGGTNSANCIRWYSESNMYLSGNGMGSTDSGATWSAPSDGIIGYTRLKFNYPYTQGNIYPVKAGQIETFSGFLGVTKGSVATAGDFIAIQCNGIVNGFTDLTPGKRCFIGSSDNTISDIETEMCRGIGFALTENTIMITRERYKGRPIYIRSGTFARYANFKGKMVGVMNNTGGASPNTTASQFWDRHGFSNFQFGANNDNLGNQNNQLIEQHKTATTATYHSLSIDFERGDIYRIWGAIQTGIPNSSYFVIIPEY